MKSKNTFYIIFWLAGSLFVLGYFCLNKSLSLDPKYVTCFSISAFSVSIASFLAQISEEYKLPKIVKMLLDLVNYIFMGVAMFSLVVFPLVLANKNLSALSNCLILWSLALIFMSTVLKEIKFNLFNREKSKDENVQEKTEKRSKLDSVKEIVEGEIVRTVD